MSGSRLVTHVTRKELEEIWSSEGEVVLCLTRLLYSLCKETHGGLLEMDGRKVGVKRCTGLVARVGDH